MKDLFFREAAVSQKVKKDSGRVRHGGAALGGVSRTRHGVLRETGASPENCVLVGDRLHDIVGAHETGIKCIAVLCGFGSREEFEEYGADFIAETLLDVAALV